jgi:hypothetical protein
MGLQAHFHVPEIRTPGLSEAIHHPDLRVRFDPAIEAL